MPDLRDFLWYDEQRRFAELLRNVGKGAGYLGIEGDRPPGWTPPFNPPDPLDDPPKNLVWLPRTVFFLGKTGQAVGDNFAVGGLLIPVAGASRVNVSYAIYNVVNPEGGVEPQLYFDTAADPAVPRSWTAMTGGSFALPTSRINDASTLSFESSDAAPPKQFIRWRLVNPSTNNEVQVEISLKVTVITP